ncbi:MAG: hypothetical protein QOI01_1625 [Mycobacterium sp.]|jgi:hypothetical protein|nr:hypothetical protein [Mycobacterium sp.]
MSPRRLPIGQGIGEGRGGLATRAVVGLSAARPQHVVHT